MKSCSTEYPILEETNMDHPFKGKDNDVFMNLVKSILNITQSLFEKKKKKLKRFIKKLK